MPPSLLKGVPVSVQVTKILWTLLGFKIRTKECRRLSEAVHTVTKSRQQTSVPYSSQAKLSKLQWDSHHHLRQPWEEEGEGVELGHLRQGQVVRSSNKLSRHRCWICCDEIVGWDNIGFGQKHFQWVSWSFVLLILQATFNHLLLYITATGSFSELSESLLIIVSSIVTLNLVSFFFFFYHRFKIEFLCSAVGCCGRCLSPLFMYIIFSLAFDIYMLQRKIVIHDSISFSFDLNFSHCLVYYTIVIFWCINQLNSTQLVWTT